MQSCPVRFLRIAAADLSATPPHGGDGRGETVRPVSLPKKNYVWEEGRRLSYCHLRPDQGCDKLAHTEKQTWRDV